MEKLIIIVALIIFQISLSDENQEKAIRTDKVYITTSLNKNKNEENYQIKKYKVYALGIGIGEVYFKISDKKIEAEGKTYDRFSWLYNYDFKFYSDDNYMALYEKEGKKERIYENEAIYEKKPWLPIIAMFFKKDKSLNDILNSNILINGKPVIIRKEGRRIIFEPQESKTKRITIFLEDGKDFPTQIYIEGKVNINLELEE